MKHQNVELHNVCALIETDGLPGFETLRIPKPVWERINPGAQRMARHSAGCEIRGMLKEQGEARIVLQALDDNSTPPVVTVYHGCFCAQTVTLGKEPTTIAIKAPVKADLLNKITKDHGLPFDARLLRVKLPNIHPVRILSIEGDLSYPEPGTVPARSLLCYGSSITHGACAVTPEGTYPAQCARRLGFDHVNLGFGGSAQMDPALAEHIASRTDWDIATLEMGINVRTWPLEKFQSAVKTFVGLIVAGRPDAHVCCIDLYTNDWDFDTDPTRCAGFRAAVKDIAAQFGTGRVHYINGRTILTDSTGLRTDLVHPTDDGMAEMGANLANVISGTCGLAMR